MKLGEGVCKRVSVLTMLFGGRVKGGHYFVIFNALKPNEIQLAADHDHAVGIAAGPNGSPPAIPIAALSLTPSKTHAHPPVQHPLQKATHSPITRLPHRTTYYVVNRTPHNLQLPPPHGRP